MTHTKLICSTQVAYHLALATTVKKEDRTQYLVIPLIQLTTLVFWLWSLADLVDATCNLFNALGMAAGVYLNLGTILAKAVWWGVVP